MQVQHRLVTLVLLLLCASSIICPATKGTGSCPIKETVKICLPKCLSDFECIGYKRCCPNICGSMSCADVSPVYSGSDPRDTKGGIMCGNVRCQPKQKCESSGSMTRPKCTW